MPRSKKKYCDCHRSRFEHEVWETSLKGSRARYEAKKIPYTKLSYHNYVPDWVLPNGIIIEAKGRFTAVDRAKHLLVREQHPELDIRMVFAYDNKIHKNSNTRYSDWCDKHGIIYAFKKVPQEWIDEPKKH